MTTLARVAADWRDAVGSERFIVSIGKLEGEKLSHPEGRRSGWPHELLSISMETLIRLIRVISATQTNAGIRISKGHETAGE
jgi:hypothetical protein